ncbi:MAG TPA: M56 family metallopeptidase [Candidatus Bathyarchaeia archaeon]|nr:M56 family metallopeptidase [Candidatus Bathyarchaeia archaeon]
MNALYSFWHGMIVHLWQTTLVLVVVLLIDRALRRAPARVSHTLWSVALIKLFLPLSLFGGLSGLLYRTTAGSSAARGASSILVLRPVEAVLDPFGGLRAVGAGSTLSYALVAATTCWATLALYLISRILIDVARAGRPGGRPLAALDPDVARRLARNLDETRIPRESVLVTADFRMPAVSGLRRPRIVIPESLATDLPEDELRAILLHEDTHRRRRDPLRAAAQRLATALFFFYPPIYLVVRRLQSTAEFACDESVVHSGVSAPAYSRALARTLKLGLSSPAFAAAAAVAGSSLLRRRLNRLPTLDPRRYAMRLQYRLLLVAAALATAAATFYPLPMQAGLAGKQASPADSSRKGDSLRSQGEEFLAFDEAPVLTRTVPPKYPEVARKRGAEGTVLLNILLSAEGKVMKASVIQVSGVEMPKTKKVGKAKLEEIRLAFVKSAIESAMQFTFSPATFKGEAVPCHVAVPIRFKLH